MKLQHSWFARWRRPPAEEVMGQRIEEPRPTLAALGWGLLYLGLPLLLIGAAVDGVIQAVTGRCTGVWCWF